VFSFLVFIFSKFHLVVPSPASDVLFGVWFADGLVVLVALVVLCGTLWFFLLLFFLRSGCAWQWCERFNEKRIVARLFLQCGVGFCGEGNCGG